MVALARKTLIRQWRQFVPAVMGVAFSTVLLVVQTALVFGIVQSAALYVTASGTSIWAGYPGTQSVSLGQPIDPGVEMALRADPDVAAVAPLVWVDADWRGPRDSGTVAVFVIGIDPGADGLVFDRLLPPRLRERLFEPDAVIVDRADLDALGVQPGQEGWIGDGEVRVIAAIDGLRALGGANVIASADTARRLDGRYQGGRATYFTARLHDAERAAAVRQRLDGLAGLHRYQVWEADEFAQRSRAFWLFDTGAGVAVVFMGVIVLIVGTVIAGQSLSAVVMSLAREYATLNALGVGLPALRAVVLEKAAWVGVAGLLVGGAISALLLWLGARHGIPVDVPAQAMALCVVVVFVLTLLSGLVAMRGLARANPVELLR